MTFDPRNADVTGISGMPAPKQIGGSASMTPPVQLRAYLAGVKGGASSAKVAEFPTAREASAFA